VSLWKHRPVVVTDRISRSCAGQRTTPKSILHIKTAIAFKRKVPKAFKSITEYLQFPNFTIKEEKMFFQVCFSFILCLHFRFAAVDAFSKSNGLDEGRMKRAIGDQPPQGKCLSFKWVVKKNIKTIEYVCCNNCGETNQNCLGTSYRSGSIAQDYCDRCGGNKLRFGRKASEPFSCGGCAGQTRNQMTCRAQYSTIPVACWLFRGCFEHECMKEQRYSVDTCFNGVCDAEENIGNCPADCCQQKNPQNCIVVNGKCPLTCCGETNCCEKQDDGSGTNSGDLTFIGWLKYIGMIIGFLVLGAIMYYFKSLCGCNDDNEVHPTNSEQSTSSA
jgi:hypothetical protein